MDLSSGGEALPQLVPHTSATAALVELTLFDQRSEVLLQRIAACGRQPDGVAHRDAAMFACELDDLQGQPRQRREHRFFALDFLVKAPHLLGQRAQKERQPRLPVRCFGADRPLGSRLREGAA